MEDLLDLNEPINIYTIEPLVTEPSNIVCPIVKYDIVPTSENNGIY